MIKGHCLCGAVSIRVEHHGGFTGVCHCRMCQRWSGALYASFPAPAEGVTVTGPVARYESSPFSERAFCPTCGSHLWMREIGGPENPDYELMPGLFDAARDIPLESEIYTDRALPGLALAGDHRRATRAEYEARNPHLDADA